MRERPLDPTGMGGLRGERVAEPVSAPVRFSYGEALAVNALDGLGRLLLLIGRNWPVTGPPALLATAVWLVGPALPAVAVTVLVATLVTWRLRAPGSFEGVAGARWRAWWRREWVYRRDWQPAMVLTGLARVFDHAEYLPSIHRVVSSRQRDAVLVRLLAGQCPQQYEAVTDQLAHTFRALACRVRVDRPGRVWLDFTRTDPLQHVVPALPVPDQPDLRAVPVGVTETGGPWRVRLLGSHLLIAGCTGSGKGSVLWSLLRGLGPAIADGSVRVWAVDPKGGMELTPGAALFTRFAYADPATMVGLLEDAVVVMRERAERLRQAGARLHQPSPEDPLVLVVVDELATLTAYLPDRDLRKRAEAALSLLLTQGRAPGVLVVAAVQDPGKDVVAFRDLFPTRIALRLVEDVQTDMVLGRGARARGAECDRIPPSLPGVGYFVLDGVREPVRVRAGWVTDTDLAAMSARFAAPPEYVEQPPDTDPSSPPAYAEPRVEGSSDARDEVA